MANQTMEVLSFIELTQLATKENWEFTNNIFPLINNVKKVNSLGIEVDGNVSDFYSQKFKPELIPELFEGWVFEQQCFINGFNDIAFNNKTYLISVRNRCLFSHYYPHTLDDFINDTSRASIKLTWKINFKEN